jgi:hypothetical protein
MRIEQTWAHQVKTTRVTGGLHKPCKGVILTAPKSAPEKLYLSVTYLFEIFFRRVVGTRESALLPSKVIPKQGINIPNAPMDLAGLVELSVSHPRRQKSCSARNDRARSADYT